MASDDLARLQSFREAARQVRVATIIDKGLGANVNVWEDASGQLHISSDLLDREAFVALSASLRLVYMEKEAAHLYGVCNVLWRHASEDVHEHIAAIRGFYSEVLRTAAGGFTLTTETGSRLVRSEELLEAWMYGEVFHQDPDKRQLLQLLRKHPLFQFNLQSTVMLLCGRVLDLDDIVADLLGEPRVPRITAGTKGLEEDVPPQTPPIP